MKCPGQDRSYWQGESAFEVPCPRCGTAVEFFKDEMVRRCTRCGCRFNNPRTVMDCARWCDYAEECVGRGAQGGGALTAEAALTGRLVEAVADGFQHRPAGLFRALLVFQHAQQILSAGGDPRVILPAALLVELAGEPAEASATAGSPEDQAEPKAKAKQILRQVGLDEDAIQQVCQLIDRAGGPPADDTAELRVLRDCRRLAQMAAERRGEDPRRLETTIDTELRTDAAKEWARSLFQLEPAGD